ncbi:MAG TPA: phospholipase D-like domain-containing protein [Steroidobacteraceae bacterium]|nr:phospholipase D-like domain-containing protein [Steroidobacteraceae bacterium]
MRTTLQRGQTERAGVLLARELAGHAFSRAAGAPLVDGNSVRLLIDARENYPAWLAAIGAAKHHVHFEMYFLYEDDAGRRFADALIAKAQEGVRVRLVYDWLGGLGKASRSFWERLRAGGVDVRCFNPPRLDSPVGWLSRDHRKSLVVDAEVGFITGLCVGRMWEGLPDKNLEPWRDTGVEVRGRAVADIERAFAQVWAMTGDPIPEHELIDGDSIEPAGDVRMRIVAGVPSTAGLLRVDQLVAALARQRLWLSDAYYAGTTSYVQALRAAASDGVDVRLLVPNSTDIPLLQPLSRAGYRPLLEAGVRIFEWNGTMLHAKTAVADGQWARVGSTNLNVASWFGNCELDAIVEDAPFASLMEQTYLGDLENSTEIVLNERHRLRVPRARRPRRALMKVGGGSGGRAAAGAIRIGHAIGAAFTDRRVLEPVEARIALTSGASLLALAAVFAWFPRALAYPLVLVLAWVSIALLYKGYRLHRERGARAQREQQSPLHDPARLKPEVDRLQGPADEREP